jgi:hypothetical protein
MVEVGLATAAAPTYFDPEALGSSRLIDGGVYAGNPALVAITLALRRTTEPVPSTPRELFMVSLGTGAWSAPLDYGGGGIIGWLQPRTGGEALLEAMLGGSGDFANEAAHMLLNGDAPVQDTWEPALPPLTSAAGRSCGATSRRCPSRSRWTTSASCPSSSRSLRGRARAPRGAADTRRPGAVTPRSSTPPGGRPRPRSSAGRTVVITLAGSAPAKASVRWLGSARLLLFPCRRWSAECKGDKALVPAPRARGRCLHAKAAASGVGLAM